MNNIVSLDGAKHDHSNLEEMLEGLLEQVRNGEIDAISYVALQKIIGGKDHNVIYDTNVAVENISKLTLYGAIQMAARAYFLVQLEDLIL